MTVTRREPIYDRYYAKSIFIYTSVVCIYMDWRNHSSSGAPASKNPKGNMNWRQYSIKFQKITGDLRENAALQSISMPSISGSWTTVRTSLASAHGERNSQKSGVNLPVEPTQRCERECTVKRPTKRRPQPVAGHSVV